MKYRFLIGSLIFLCVVLLPTTPPFSFPTGSIVTVEEGVGLYALSKHLEEDNVIRSPFWFRVFSISLGGERTMKAGGYYMSRPQNVFAVAWRVFRGDHDVETVRLTVPEGFTSEDISKLLDGRFQFFDHEIFLASAPEGYLFPDTYFVPITITATSLIKLMNDNFIRKVNPYLEAIEASLNSMEEVITMASLIEAEVVSLIDRKLVSGILWKRLSIDMPLQVDSDMNTYEEKGLPIEPINNPGILAIEAALNPAKSTFLYFLTDEEGIAHYAKTFDEHKKNIDKYLR